MDSFLQVIGKGFEDARKAAILFFGRVDFIIEVAGQQNSQPSFRVETLLDFDEYHGLLQGVTFRTTNKSLL